MNCPACGQEVAAADNFCRHCGAALGQTPAAAGGGLPAVVAALQGEVARLSRRVDALESGPSPTPAAAPAAKQSTPQPGAAAAAPAAASPGGFPGRLRTMDWEWLLGGNWLARVGILAVVLGIGFFLRLAFDNNWIGETGRVILGLVVGLALLGAGEYWRRKYAVWAQALTGGGIAILYLAVFAAISLYELIPALPALGFFLLVTATAAGLALRYAAPTIAILGVLGGFAAPMLLWGRLPDARLLLAYVLLLDLGVLALATFRNWRWLTLLGLVGSLILYGYWLSELEPSLLLAQVGLTLLFLIFVGATTLFHLLWRRPPGAVDQALMTLNGLAYFAFSFSQMYDELEIWMGGFTLLLAAFYGGLAYAITWRYREQVRLSLFAVGLAFVFLTIAIPLALAPADLPTALLIALAWAAEAAALLWLSFALKLRPLRWFAMGLFILLAGYVSFPYTFYPAYGEYRFLGNERMAGYAAVIAAMYLSAYALWRYREQIRNPIESAFRPVLLAAANLLTIYVLSLELATAFGAGGDFWIDDYAVRSNVISLALSLLWAVYAAALLVLGIMRRNRWIRIAGLGLLAIPIVKLFAFDAFALEREYRVAAFILLGLMLLAGGYLYQRYRRLIRGFLLND